MSVEEEISGTDFGQVDRALKSMLGTMSNLDTARTLLNWQGYLVQGVRKFAEQAVPLVQMTSAGRITALITVLKHLSGVFENYQSQLAELEAFLATNEGNDTLRALPDGPQPGDVRAVLGEPQVFVDGSWFALGAWRAP